jgi:hypothetical protein
VFGRLTSRLNGFFVSAYKLVGFAALLAMLTGVVAFFGVQIFFLVSSSWLSPAVLSPGDPRVLQLSTQLAQQAAARDQLRAQRLDVQVRLADARRVADQQKRFQERLAVAMRSDAASRQVELRRVEQLLADYRSAHEEIRRSNEAFSGMSRERASQERKARLIDQDRFVTVNQQLAQIGLSNLGLAETNVDLTTRADALRRQVTSLRSVQKGAARDDVTYEALHMEQELVTSMLAEARARDEISALEESLQLADEALGRYDEVVAAIERSPYLDAFQRQLHVAFVPYENRANVTEGEELYGCYLRVIACKRVGHVGKALEGEVRAPHPVDGTEVRGVMVEVHLEDDGWVEKQILHAGGAPFLL